MQINYVIMYLIIKYLMNCLVEKKIIFVQLNCLLMNHFLKVIGLSVFNIYPKQV